MKSGCFKFSSMPGNAGWRPSRPIALFGLSIGASTGFRRTDRQIGPLRHSCREWVEHVMADTDAFFTPPPTTDYTLGPASPDGDRLLTFPSAFTTPHEKNNTVYARLFPPRGQRSGTDRRAAVLVLPQWNSDAGGHVGLSKLLAMNGMTALRLSLPYHDRRMPPELERADYIVSANVARTVQVCRQAVLDARRAIAGWPRKGTSALASSVPVSDRVSRC